MRPDTKRRRPGFIRRFLSKDSARNTSRRSLGFQSLEQRHLLAGDVGFQQPLADITGLWITVGNREYFTSEQASVTVDMFAGETLQVTGVQYNLDASVTPDHGVIAFESYVRREHGAAEVGSYDYTDGRFADPVADELLGGAVITHPGFDSGWELDVIDNRVAVVAIRYFADEFVVEDRLLVDVNVVQPDEMTTWTETISPVRGEWETDHDEDEGEGVGGDSRIDDPAGLTVIETDSIGSDRYEVGVKAKTVEENTYANGFVVVDYRNENDFIYAGLRSIADKWVIGHFDGKFRDLATLKQDIQPRQVYDLRVAVDGSQVALAADGVFRVSHDFDRPLDQGVVGLANQYAFTHFTDFHFFENSEKPAGPGEIDTTVVTDSNGTTITFGEGSDNPTSDAEHAVQQATTAATQAQQASEAASAAASRAERNQHEAETHAIGLEAIGDQSAAAAARAASAHYEAVLAEKEAGYHFTHAAATLQSAEEAMEIAATSADQAARDLQQSEQAAGTDGNAKKEKKTAKKAKGKFNSAEAVIQQFVTKYLSHKNDSAKKEKVSKKVTEISDAEQLTKAQESLEQANQALEQASQRLNDAQQAYDAAYQNLATARQQVERLAEQAAIKNDQAQSAAAQADEARQAADQAAAEADHARQEASRLAQEAEVAGQALTEAELALQQLQETSADHNDDAFRAYSLNFNHQDDGAFETVAGRSQRVAGQLHLIPDQDQIAVSVLDNEALPERTATRVYTTVRADELPGFYQNGFIVFDYQSPEDFKYAGAWAGADRWAVGEVVDGQLVDLATLDEVIGQGAAYELQVWIEGSTLTFLVEGQQKLQHTFEQPIDDGQIGVASYNARSRFDQVAVMQLYGGAGDVGIEHADVNTAAADAAINELF